MQIELSHDQALVLLDYLARIEERNSYQEEHAAEVHVLLAVSGQLERTMVEIIDPRYGEIVDAARERIRLQFGDLVDGLGRRK
jgi:hypothetical protein